MVKDKINHRARGPKTIMTRQSVHGRANDGGLRIGEMERDGLIAHGSSKFIQESFMIRGDEYAMAICNTSGCVAVYNIRENNFYSLHSDGNIEFANDINDSMKIKSVSRFGRNFSIVNIPYSFKLLIQELQTMNIQIRLITEDNVDNFKSDKKSKYTSIFLTGSNRSLYVISGFCVSKNKLRSVRLILNFTDSNFKFMFFCSCTKGYRIWKT